MQYWKDLDTGCIYDTQPNPSCVPIELGELKPITEPYIGMCVKDSFNRVGWWERKNMWGDHKVMWSNEPSYAETVYLRGLLHVPDHDIVVPEIKAWIKSGGKWYLHKETTLYSLITGKVGVTITGRDPYSESFEKLEGVEETSDEPEEFMAINPFSGGGSVSMAKSKVGGNYYIAHDHTAYYITDTSSGELFITRSIELAFHFFSCDKLPFQDPVLSLFTLEQVKTELILLDTHQGLVRWLLNKVKDIPHLAARLAVTGVRRSTKDQSAVSLYSNYKKKETSILTLMRPGRAFRFLFPEMKDKDLEKLVDAYREDFPVQGLTLKRGTEAHHFKHMYGHQYAPMENPKTTSSRKSLANSCMRHDFSNLPRHPCEVYGSGEFEAIWSEDSLGRIASRLVVWHPPEDHSLHENPQMGPVYGVSEYAMDMLEEAVPNGVHYERATWVDAKILRIPHQGGIIAPYLDHEQSLEDAGNYLIIGGEPDYEADSYDGVLGRSRYAVCENCGRDIRDEYDAYNTDDGCVCESCYDNNYFCCDDYGDTYHIDVRCEVMKSSWRGNHWYEVYVCEDARDSNYTLCTDDKYWPNESVQELANGDWISPKEIPLGNYAECSVDNLWYAIEDMYPNVDGGYTAKENFAPLLQGLNEHGEVYELA